MFKMLNFGFSRHYNEVPPLTGSIPIFQETNSLVWSLLETSIQGRKKGGTRLSTLITHFFWCSVLNNMVWHQFFQPPNWMPLLLHCYENNTAELMVQKSGLLISHYNEYIWAPQPHDWDACDWISSSESLQLVIPVSSNSTKPGGHR